MLNERSSTPFSDFTWPLPDNSSPGSWVAADGPVAPCRTGIHACTSSDLTWWLSTNLWEIELDGPIVRTDRQVVGPRGRIVAAVSDWPQARDGLPEWCFWRTRGYAADALRDAGHDETAAELVQLTEKDEVGGLLQAFTGEAITSVGIACVLAAGAATLPNPVIATHVGARAAGNLACARADGSADAYYAAFADERKAQSLRLSEQLGLADDPGLEAVS